MEGGSDNRGSRIEDRGSSGDAAGLFDPRFSILHPRFPWRSPAMTGFHELAPAAIASAFGFGMILAILGSLGPFLSEKMEIPPSPFPLPPGERGRGEGERVRGWISVVFLALIPFVFLSGIVTDQWGWRVTLVAGSLLAGLGLFGLSVGRDVWMTWLCLTG